MRDKCCRNCKHFTNGRCIMSDTMFNLEEEQVLYGEDFEEFEGEILRKIKEVFNMPSDKLDVMKDILEELLYDVAFKSKQFKDGLEINDYTRMLCSYYE